MLEMKAVPPELGSVAPDGFVYEEFVACGESFKTSSLSRKVLDSNFILIWNCIDPI
jgi:hypothetical protein